MVLTLTVYIEKFFYKQKPWWNSDMWNIFHFFWIYVFDIYVYVIVTSYSGYIQWIYEHILESVEWWDP